MAITGILLAGSVVGAPLREGASVAFFGIEFLDTSTEGAYRGEREDETQRVAMLETYVAGQFEERGFVLLDLDPVHEEVNRFANVADCNGCDVDMARKLGADYAMVGLVQKTSNLILAIRLVVSDARTGAMEKGLSVDIRGNNDRSWLRGMSYILRNNVFKQ